MAAVQNQAMIVQPNPVSGQEKRNRKYATPANANNRVGVIWAPEEEANLKREFLSGQSLQEIADLHQRAPKAIELRLAKIAAEEVTETNPVTSVCAQYRVTESMVRSEMKKLEKKAQPKRLTLEARITALEEQVRQLQAVIAGLTAVPM